MKAVLMAGCLLSAVAPLDPPARTDRRFVFLGKVFGPQPILETMPGGAFDTARGFPRQSGGIGTGVAKRPGQSSASGVGVLGVNGGLRIAMARLAGVCRAWGIAATWKRPDQGTPLRIFQYSTPGLSGKAESNVRHAFWPGLNRKLGGS